MRRPGVLVNSYSRDLSIGTRWLVVTLLTMTVASAPLSMAQQRPQFRSRVEVVQLQVSVADRSGNFASRLGTSDFRLRVDGKERELTTVYEVDLGRGDEGGMVDLDAMPPAAWRQWVLFFDVGFNTPRGVLAAQQSAQEFIRTQVHQRDLVGVATFSTVSGVRLLVPLTRDRRQVLEGVAGLGLVQASRTIDRAGFIAGELETALQPDQDPTRGAEVAGELVRNVASLEFQQYTGVVASYAEQVGALGQMLQAIRGRKHVVFFSTGFDDRVITGQSLDQLAATTAAIQSNAGEALAASDVEERFGSAEVRSALDDSFDELRAADAVIHVVDPSGVGGGRNAGLAAGGIAAGTFDQRGSSRSALNAFAAETGGTTTWDTNDLSSALGELERSTRAYYVLAFARQRDDSGVLDIDVETTGSDVEVSWAPESLASPIAYTDMNPMQRQAQLAEFITKGIVDRDMTFDMTTVPFVGDGEVSRVATVVEVPWEQLEDLESSGEDNRVELEIFSYVLADDGSMLDLSNGQVGLDMESMRSSPVAGLPLRFYDLLWSRAGSRQVRVIVRDNEVGRISAFNIDTDVPNYTEPGLAVAGPVAIDWQHPGLIVRGIDPAAPPPTKADGPVAYPFVIGDTELTPTARAAGPPGSMQQLYLVVHNLVPNPFTGQTQSAVGVRLRPPEGEPMALDTAEVVGSMRDPATGATQMLVNALLPTGLPSGFYTFVVNVNDMVSGVTIERDVPVWVSPPTD